MSSAAGERLQLATDGDDWTWTGKVFQTAVAATGNERWPIVVRRYDGHR